ncbi:hypothetical protein DB88DRAFT_298041 [Papiliotrema laurentii]|uniref:MSP domain-containing protein n=1 Tax=Papiliotrema laurentii TaxID=5418 RepID=A0AAD9CZ48_PAPLA|nr:hypothetical protein DB88DRAFT_298041 [Papiliotrema laurentii]
MYLDKAREEWGGPAALKQGNSSPSSHSGFGVAPGGHGAGETVDGPRPTLSPVPGGGKREIQDEDEWSTYYLAVSKRVGDEADHVDFIAPRAINPIYANVSHDQVYKRADSGPIYGSSGKPQMTDVHQTTNPSCGFASVLAAVVNVNPAWISSHISFSGDRNSVSTAKVTLYDPNNFAPKTFDISCAETAIMSDVDPATGVWWPGAYDHAGVKLGLDNSNGAMGPISPQKSL